MTRQEIIYMAGALLTVGVFAGMVATNWGHIDRCEKYGTTFMQGKAVLCSIRPDVKEAK